MKETNDAKEVDSVTETTNNDAREDKREAIAINGRIEPVMATAAMVNKAKEDSAMAIEEQEMFK